MYRILSASHTELGQRERNEDYQVAAELNGAHFFALADGLGGHGLGDEASRLVCDTAARYFYEHPQITNESFPAIYALCQDTLFSRQKELRASKKMRTTLNITCISDQTAYWSHIGDSRTYYFRDKQLCKRTFDHSVPQMLAASGELEESQIRFHEDRNRLLRVLGVEGRAPAYEAEEPVPLTGNQQFLLCTDGFWELITEEQILLCLDEAEEPGLWVDNMVELVNRNGRGKKTDNMTALAVWIYQ